MGLQAHRVDEKKRKFFPFVRPDGLMYDGVNSGFATRDPVSAIANSAAVSQEWASYASGSNLFVGGRLAAPYTFAMGNTVVAVGSTAKSSGYDPETLARLARLEATPLDPAAPEGEQEFLDWLNSD